MPLEFYNIYIHLNAKFTIFASTHRLQRRSCILDIYVIGLATKGACLLTGLFLFIQLSIKRLRDLVFIPVKLIKQAHEEDWLRSLAYFVRMKSLYVNNTHYGFTLRSLGDKLGITPATLGHHLRILKGKKIVSYHGKNLTFLGFDKLVSLYRSKSIGVPVDHQNQLTLVRSQLIRFNLSSQKYNIKRSEIQNCPSEETPLSFRETTHSCYTGLSAHGFGKVLGLSFSQGAALRARMIHLGVLKATRRFSSLFLPFGESSGRAPSGRVLRTALIQGKTRGYIPTYAFIKNGSVWIERRMELEYLRAEVITGN